MIKFDKTIPPRKKRKSRGKGGKRNFKNEKPKRFGKNRRDAQLSTVTCATCKKKCEVPFKPNSNKPIFCDACFGKGDAGRGDLRSIHEKLDKIMDALDIPHK
ncbi:MAG: hypothetical protein OXR66_01640 [Candidatus Woesearchaeota archaeon]|nr:hypothetical protein [Candidatus Woesearchaeota archaeon]